MDFALNFITCHLSFFSMQHTVSGYDDWHERGIHGAIFGLRVAIFKHIFAIWNFPCSQVVMLDLLRKELTETAILFQLS